jgi:hypothetical protein
MGEPWFQHNQRGFGPGRPIHRNGWIALGSYVFLLIVFPWPMQMWLGYDPNSLQRFIAILAITIPFGIVAWKKTEGGWGLKERQYEDE